MIQNLFSNSNLLAHTAAFVATGALRCNAPLLFQSDETTNLFPSLSLNIAYVPHGWFCGGPSNSTPRFFNSWYVLSISSQVNDMFINEPIRFSSPSGVKKTKRVSAFGIRSSIQRCFSSNG